MPRKPLSCNLHSELDKKSIKLPSYTLSQRSTVPSLCASCLVVNSITWFYLLNFKDPFLSSGNECFALKAFLAFVSDQNKASSPLSRKLSVARLQINPSKETVYNRTIKLDCIPTLSLFLTFFFERYM